MPSLNSQRTSWFPSCQPFSSFCGVFHYSEYHHMLHLMWGFWWCPGPLLHTTIEANGLLWGMELKASTWPFEFVAWFKAYFWFNTCNSQWTELTWCREGCPKNTNCIDSKSIRLIKITCILLISKWIWYIYIFIHTYSPTLASSPGPCTKIAFSLRFWTGLGLDTSTSRSPQSPGDGWRRRPKMRANP